MIAADLDNTIVNTTAHFMRAAALAQGVPDLALPDPDTYDNHGRYYPDADAAQRYFDRAYGGLDLALMLDCPPIEDARDVLITLHRHGLLGAYVTRRPAAQAYVTRQWLSRHGLPDLPVHHARASKADVMRQHGYTGLIDDAPFEAQDVARHYPVAVPRRAYNTHVRGPNIRPFTRWRDLPITHLLP